MDQLLIWTQEKYRGDLIGLQIFESPSLLQSSSIYRALLLNIALCQYYLIKTSLDVGIISNSQAPLKRYLCIRKVFEGKKSKVLYYSQFQRRWDIIKASIEKYYKFRGYLWEITESFKIANTNMFTFTHQFYYCHLVNGSSLNYFF